MRIQSLSNVCRILTGIISQVEVHTSLSHGVCVCVCAETKFISFIQLFLKLISIWRIYFKHMYSDMHKDLCRGMSGLCEAMRPTKGADLLKYLRKVNFTGT